jgi:hypothetical protein
VKQRLAYVRAAGTATDEAFVVHRTFADPRFMDLSLDSNDRKVGGIWGNAREANYASNSIGRYTTLTAFLSQWASVSQADGPANVARTSVPVQYVDLTGDASAFPSTRNLWMGAIGSRGKQHAIKGADHYLRNAAHLAEATDVVVEFAARL